MCKPELFGTDGIRGVAGQYPLDLATVEGIGRALGTVLGKATGLEGDPFLSLSVTMSGRSPMPPRIYLARGSRGGSVTITAKYEGGVFKPLEDVSISEGTIVEVRVPSYADRLKRKARSVGDFAFYGMWKDRTDIGDSVEYISNLRRDLRG